jgi:hypothetical protein
MMAAGSYTFWGKHFRVNQKILKKLNIRQKKRPGREKELAMLSKTLKTKSGKKVNKIEKVDPQTKISQKIEELDLLKRLVEGKN